MVEFAHREEPHMIWQQLHGLIGSYPLALRGPLGLDRRAVADQPRVGHADRLCPRRTQGGRQPCTQRRDRSLGRFDPRNAVP